MPVDVVITVGVVFVALLALLAIIRLEV